LLLGLTSRADISHRQTGRDAVRGEKQIPGVLSQLAEKAKREGVITLSQNTGLNRLLAHGSNGQARLNDGQGEHAASFGAGSEWLRMSVTCLYSFHNSISDNPWR